MAAICFELNGKQVTATDVSAHLSLLSWLRQSGATGTKEGCAEGECGACAVAWLDRDAEGRGCYRSVNSCLVPMGAVHGRSIVTVEGISSAAPAVVSSSRSARERRQPPIPSHVDVSSLHPVQRSLVQQSGSQCGYCTPGFVVSLFCEYYRPDRSEYDAQALSGNLCRCTGYRPIVDAAKSLPSPPPPDEYHDRLAAGPPVVEPFNYQAAGSHYHRPGSVPELLEARGQEPNAVLVAGATDVMIGAEAATNEAAPMLDLSAIAELQDFENGAQAVQWGAGLTFTQLEQQLHRHELLDSLRAVTELIPLFASRLVRNRATVGGNLATASPIGDLAPVLLALDAQLVMARSDERHVAPIAAFFTGYRQTLLTQFPLLLSVRIPKPFPAIQRFYKVSRRPLDDISTVSAAFALQLDERGRVVTFRVAFGGVASTPVLVDAVNPMARGRAWQAELLPELTACVLKVGTPLSDHRGSAGYRRALMQTLLERFMAETLSEKRSEL